MKRLTQRMHAPYVGLRPFEERDSLLFFGRTRNTEELLARFAAAPISTKDAPDQGGLRFVAVLGASGTGKSSLVRAGLIPALLRGGTRLPSTRRWNIATIKPGNAPMANLTEALTKLGTLLGDFDTLAARQFLAARLAASPLGLLEQWQESIDRHPDEALLVFVDQFEEIFRYRQVDLNEAEAFVKLLLRSATVPGVPIYVVITMRADFLDQAVAFRQLPDAINNALYLTPRLDIEELRSVVTSPLRLVGGSIEPALVARLLNDLGGDDELPVLQHALLRMWVRAHSAGRHSILTEDYRAICAKNAPAGELGAPSEPRLQASIDNHATEILMTLTGEGDQRIARELFVCLVDRLDDRLVRRERTWAELLRRFGPDDEPACRRVVDAYRAEGVGFLLPHGGTSITADTVIDIAHESLFRQWRFLQQWLLQEVDDVRSLNMYVDRAQRRANKGGGWLDEQDTNQALGWVAAMETRGTPDCWAMRYQEQADAVTLVKRYASASKDDLDTTIAGQAKKDRAMARRTQVGIVLLAVAFMVSTIMFLQTRRSEMEAVRLRAVAEKKQGESDELRQREKVLAENWKMAAHEAEIRTAQAIAAGNAQKEADTSAAEALAKASISRKEADAQRELATFQGIWGSLLFLGESNENTYAPLGLLYLARTDVSSKQFVLQRILDEPERARKFNENPVAILRAAIGVSPDMHQWLLTRVRKAPLSSDQSVIRARALVNAYLDKPNFEAIIDELQAPTRPARVKVLSDELVELSRAEPDKAGQRAIPLLNVIKATSNAEHRPQLYRSLEILAAQIAPPIAEEVANAIVELPPRPAGYEKTLRLCVARMSDGERARSLARIIPKFSEAFSEQRYRAVQASILISGMQLPAAQTEFVAERILAGITATVDPVALTTLREGVISITAKLDRPLADRLLPKYVEAFISGDDTDQRKALEPGIERLALLGSENIVREQMAAFNQSADPVSGPEGDRVFDALSKRVPSAEADIIVRRLLDMPKLKSGLPQWSPSEQALLVQILRRASRPVLELAVATLDEALDRSPTGADIPLAEALGKSPLPGKSALHLMRAALHQLAPEVGPETQRAAASVIVHLSALIDPADARELAEEIGLRISRFRGSRGVEEGVSKVAPAMADALLVVASVGADGVWSEAPNVLKIFLDNAEPRGLPSSPVRLYPSLLDSRTDTLRSILDHYNASAILSDLNERPVRIAQAVPKPAIRATFIDLINRTDRFDGADFGLRGPIIMSAVGRTLATSREIADAADIFDILIKGVPTCARVGITPLSSKIRLRCDILFAWLKAPRSAAVSTSIVAKQANNLENWPAGLGAALQPLLSNIDANESNRIASALLKASEKTAAGESPERISMVYEALLAVLPNVTQHRAVELRTDILIRARQSTDPVVIGRLSGIAAALAPRLPANLETRAMLLEFMKFPSAKLHPLINALRQAVPDVPPYGSSPTIFLPALSRNPALHDLDLNAPALQKPDDAPAARRVLLSQENSKP